MSIRTRMVGTVAILDVSGKLMGGPECDDLRLAIKRVAAEGAKKVLLNLAEVPWINSTGLGMLIAGYTSLAREGGTLRLCSVPDRIQSLLTVTRLSSILEAYGDEAAALAAMRR